MKVKEQGNKAVWSVEVRCDDTFERPGCGAVLEIDTGDLKIEYYGGDDRPGDSPSYSASVVCPECGAVIYVRGVPENVMRYVHNGAYKRLQERD